MDSLVPLGRGPRGDRNIPKHPGGRGETATFLVEVIIYKNLVKVDLSEFIMHFLKKRKEDFCLVVAHTTYENPIPEYPPCPLILLGLKCRGIRSFDLLLLIDQLTQKRFGPVCGISTKRMANYE